VAINEVRVGAGGVVDGTFLGRLIDAFNAAHFAHLRI